MDQQQQALASPRQWSNSGADRLQRHTEVQLRYYRMFERWLNGQVTEVVVTTKFTPCIVCPEGGHFGGEQCRTLEVH